MGYCLINNRISYDMRNNQDFVIPSFRTNIREQCVSVMGPRVWQLIPNALRSSESLAILKRVVCNHFLSMY